MRPSKKKDSKYKPEHIWQKVKLILIFQGKMKIPRDLPSKKKDPKFKPEHILQRVSLPYIPGKSEDPMRPSFGKERPKI